MKPAPRWLVAAIGVLGMTCAAPRHEPHILPAVQSLVPLPPGFGPPPEPADNELTQAKVILGRHLFYDTRLSRNRTQSCASCHQQERAFTDGRAHAIGSTGEEHHRNTMGLGNVAFRSPLTWASRETRTLEQQILVPLTNHDPVELGMDGHFDELLVRLRVELRYGELFAAAFPLDSEPMTIANVAKALASFERTLISGHSRYDRLVRRGDSDALTPAEWRGMRLFFSPRLACSTCHGGRDFGTPQGVDEGSGLRSQGSGARPDKFPEPRALSPEPSLFQNTGLYDVDGKGAYPSRDPGLVEPTARRKGAGRFRVPSLRNVAVTAPYMHDGSAATLSDVIDDYAAGGRAARMSGKRPTRGVAIRAFSIAPEEKDDLIAFMNSLTDVQFATDPRFGDPWKVVINH